MSATLIVLVCALMCPLMMGLMMLLMRKGHADSHQEPADRLTKPRDEPAD